MENLVIENKPKKENWFKRLIHYFSLYEWIWYISLVVASIVVAILFPEMDVNGVDGIVIMILYILDVVIALLCELLTSKQSKWSFFIYIFVEIIEIVILIILKTRFATLAVSIFIWMPLHIISFINWSKHPDKMNKELTTVRSLKPWQTILVIVGCIVWTIGIGYLVAAYAPDTDFYSSDAIKKAIAYIDACVSAVQLVNGILLFFRFKENWIVWYISVALETVINIMSGQWELLVLKVGYVTNTTYGYMKWTRYIKQNKNQNNKEISKNSSQNAEKVSN